MGKVVGQGKFIGNNQENKEEPQNNYDELLKYISIQLGDTVPDIEKAEQIEERDSKTDIFMFVIQFAIIFAALIYPVIGSLKR